MFLRRNFYACKITQAFVLLSALILTSCASNLHWNRKSQADNFQKIIASRTEYELSQRDHLTLEDCIDIALKNNLQGQAAEIQARIRMLERDIAFSNFLPVVTVDMTYKGWDRQPETKIGSDENGQPMYKAMHDKSFADTSINVQMPIIMPSTWFLYSMYSKGEEISNLVVEYTRQLIVLKVSTLYFNYISLQRAEASLKKQVDAIRSMRDELNELYKEGMILQWELDQTEALLMSKEFELNSTGRNRHRIGSELMVAMGLSPLADFILIEDTPLMMPEGTLEDLIMQALCENPRLLVADFLLEVEREKAKMAIADFLPKLLGFATYTHTTNDFSKYANSTILGLSGVMSVFSGFSTVNEYKAARQREKEAYIKREEESLNIMLQVINTDLDLQEAQEKIALAKKSLDAANGRLAQIEAQWDEGMINTSTRLKAIAEKDYAEMAVISATFYQQTKIASLLSILDINRKSKEGENNES